MTERQLMTDCLRRLNRAGITYYLTGSMASNYWGIPRTTHDLDFVIELPPSAVSTLIREFSGDYYIDETAVRSSHLPPHQFDAIDTRSALKVNFWLSKTDPFDKEMLRRRIPMTLLGEPAWIATAEDVILHKLIWNRNTPSERQVGDTAGIVAVQSSALDAAHLEKWGQELGLSGILQQLLSGKIRPKQT